MAKRKNKRKPLPPWTPFEEAEFKPMPRQQILALAAKAETSVARVERALAFEEKNCRVFLNSRYQVTMEDAVLFNDSWPAMVHLSIKRLDREAIHDWRDLQRIKNELVGEEHEALEVYPAEERKLDTSNQYHLWVFKEAGVKLPFGFVERRITSPEDVYGTGAKQREHED